MVTLHRVGNWKISVYGGDHGIPHFHIEGRTFRCSVAIVTLEIIVGSVPSGVLRDAIGWARENHAAIRAKWQELNR